LPENFPHFDFLFHAENNHLVFIQMSGTKFKYRPEEDLTAVDAAIAIINENMSSDATAIKGTFQHINPLQFELNAAHSHKHYFYYSNIASLLGIGTIEKRNYYLQLLNPQLRQ